MRERNVTDKAQGELERKLKRSRLLEGTRKNVKQARWKGRRK
jgi:hypothetical protein